jgi:hypothetical protein
LQWAAGDRGQLGRSAFEEDKFLSSMIDWDNEPLHFVQRIKSTPWLILS